MAQGTDILAQSRIGGRVGHGGDGRKQGHMSVECQEHRVMARMGEEGILLLRTAKRERGICPLTSEPGRRSPSVDTCNPSVLSGGLVASGRARPWCQIPPLKITSSDNTNGVSLGLPCQLTQGTKAAVSQRKTPRARDRRLLSTEEQEFVATEQARGGRNVHGEQGQEGKDAPTGSFHITASQQLPRSTSSSTNMTGVV